MSIASFEVELDHHCERCGAVSTAIVLGRGSGSDRDGDGRFLADTNAQRDAAALIRLARCPRCSRRNPSAVRRLWWRGGLAVVAIAALAAFVGALGDGPFDLALLSKLTLGPFGVMALIAVAVTAGITVRQLLGSEDRVRFRSLAADPADGQIARARERD
jgi:hypothetical protein